MARTIEVEVEDARATFALLEDLTPTSGAALWESLPLVGRIRHGKWSGDACYLMVDRGPLTELPEKLELAVASIYRGYLVVVPRAAPGQAELLLSYGTAESRTATGRRYATPLAELQGDGGALFEALRRTQVEGEKNIAIRQVEG
jgi:hypothetical protein